MSLPTNPAVMQQTDASRRRETPGLTVSHKNRTAEGTIINVNTVSTLSCRIDALCRSCTALVCFHVVMLSYSVI